MINDFIVLKSEVLIPDIFYKEGYASDGILISLCVKGTVQIAVNIQNKQMLQNDLLVIMPQSVISVKDADKEGLFFCLIFRFDTISELILPSDYHFLNTLTQHPILGLTTEETQMYIRYFELLKSNKEQTHSIFHDSILKYLLFSLIGQINVFYAQKEETLTNTSRKDLVIFNFFNLAHQHYMTERSVQFYADKLKLTPKYLTTLIRQRTGKSISIIITELVIIKAKSYLSASDLLVYEIAERLNFTDASQFCRYFKKYTNSSPLIYRKSTL